jgi:hypothetical protein
MLENGWGIDFKTSRWLVPTLIGFGVGLLVLLLAWIASRARWLHKAGFPNQFGLVTMSWIILLGVILSPTNALSGLNQKEACESDVMTSMDQVGKYLSQMIPAGARVYWKGSLSAAPLLFIPDAVIYPAQINDGYSFRHEGNPDELIRFGLWNETLREQWLDEADYIVIYEDTYDQNWKSFFESGQYEELPRSPSTYPCERNTRLRIFHRVILSTEN